MTEATHVLRRELRRDERLNLELFRDVSVPEFYRLKALITLEQVDTAEWSKKNKNRNWQNCDGRLLTLIICKWSCDEHAVYFWR